MNWRRSVCDLTHCSVARLGSRWALTLAPHCVQLIWTRTACRTCWLGHPCTASSGTRARWLCTSARAMWVGSVGQWERDAVTCRFILLQFVQSPSLNYTHVHFCAVITVCGVGYLALLVFDFFLLVFVVVKVEWNSAALCDSAVRLCNRPRLKPLFVHFVFMSYFARKLTVCLMLNRLDVSQVAALAAKEFYLRKNVAAAA